MVDELQADGHPGWCAADHHCEYARGGMHRSLSEVWVMPVGRLVVRREGRGNGWLVMEWTAPVRGDGAALVAKLRRALEVMQRSLFYSRDDGDT